MYNIGEVLPCQLSNFIWWGISIWLSIGEAIKHIVYFLRGEEKMFAHDSDAYEHGVRGDTVPKSMYVKIDAITKMPTQWQIPICFGGFGEEFGFSLVRRKNCINN